MKASSLWLARIAAVFRREPWWAEFWSALTMMGWAALSYASPRDMWTWPSMSYLLRIAPEAFWHTAGFALGLAQLTALVGDWRWCRWVCAILACWFWAVLTLGVWTAVPWAPGTIVYAGWCGINVFSILRLIRRHG